MTNGSGSLLCADYRRVSSQRQMDRNADFMQAQMNKEMIRRINGVYVGEFCDEAQSAFHKKAGQRPAIQALISAIGRGEINCVVFYDESRLSRQIVDFYTEVIHPIFEVNANVVFYKSSTGQKWNPISEESLQQMIYAFRESEKKASLAKNSQEVALKKHKRPGGRLPFGIKAIGSGKIIPDHNLAVVVYIFELASWGYSERAIADLLNDQGIPSSSASLWIHTSIHHILHNKIYIGKGQWNRRVSKHNSAPRPDRQATLFDEFPSLIPNTLWELAHQALRLNTQNAARRKDTPFLLGDLAECANCHVLLKAKNSTKKATNSTRDDQEKRYYFCPTCNNRWQAQFLHCEVVNHLQKSIQGHLSQESMMKTIKKWERNIKNEINELKNKLEDLRYHIVRNKAMSDGLEEEALQSLDHHSLATTQEIELRIHEHWELLDEVTRMMSPEMIDTLVQRNLSFDGLLTSIEKRHLLYSAIEKLRIYPMNKGGQLSVDIEYRHIPLPCIR